MAVTVAYKPGVTDPVGKSARVAVEDTLGRPLGDDAAVYTSTLYLLDGVDATRRDGSRWELLANPVIQTVRIETLRRVGSPPPTSPSRGSPAHATAARSTRSIFRGATTTCVGSAARAPGADPRRDARRPRPLPRRRGATRARRALGLGARPTDAELECIAQTWSEHCKHKIFNATSPTTSRARRRRRSARSSRRYIRGATEAVDRAIREREGRSWLVSVFHDNAGVVAFDERRPPRLQGRDPQLPLGPRPVRRRDHRDRRRQPRPVRHRARRRPPRERLGYCFASPFHDGPLPKGLLHPRRIRDGVHRGVIDGGNQSGIPYGRGLELFDDRFLGKPLVFCGTVGALPGRRSRGGPGTRSRAPGRPRS